MSSTTSDSINCRANSAQSHWERLAPHLSGLSQASFTTWSATSGGKDRGTSRSWLISKPSLSFVPEAFDPLPDHPIGYVDSSSDVGKSETVGAKKHDPGPPGDARRSRRSPLQRLKFAAFLLRKINNQRRSSSTSHSSTLLFSSGSAELYRHAIPEP